MTDNRTDSLVDIDDMNELRVRVLSVARELKKEHGSPEEFKKCYNFLSTVEPEEEKRSALHDFVNLIPIESGYIDLYHDVILVLLDLTESMCDPRARKTSLLRISNELPKSAGFLNLFKDAIGRTIRGANDIDDLYIRRGSLMSIAELLPGEEQFTELRYYAISLALGLSDDPLAKRLSMDKLAFELPKSCDYEFFQNNSFLGVAGRMPKEGRFQALYLDAIDEAMKATECLEEPYFRKYALVFISNLMPDGEAFAPYYRRAMEKAYEATMRIRDPFVNHITLLELFYEIPKRIEYYPKLLKIIENILPFYTIKGRMGDVEFLDVVDYVIVAEERKMNENKKNRYTRETYAKKFAKGLDEFGGELNDIRFIGLLKPFSHPWVRPVELRDAIKRIVERLESLKDTFHGNEIQRPLLIKDMQISSDRSFSAKRENASLAKANNTISIDIGASNTVVMRKTVKGRPENISPPGITRSFSSIDTVPTVLSLETGAIGTEALGHSPITNLKKLLLDGNPRGREYMEKFIGILFGHLKEEITPRGWLKVLKNAPSETFYITNPVGFRDYRLALKDIIERTVKGINVEFLEEPLAAALGYQVADVQEKTIMIIDFGGCTMDVMVVRLTTDSLNVVAKPDRSYMLGGSDIDIWFAKYLAEKGSIPGDEPSPELIRKAEELKVALSEKSEVDFEWKGEHVCRVSTADFEDMLEANDFYHSIDRVISLVISKTRKIGIKTDAISAVLLTGGSSQIPSFKDKIGERFPDLRADNAIFDHSPFSAVATGATLYGTRDVTDRHLATAYALRFITKERGPRYELVLEKGELMPFERTFTMEPARTLGVQKEIFLEFYEVPDAFITRRWELEGGIEQIKQALKHIKNLELKPFKIVTLDFEEPITAEVEVTLSIGENGRLKVVYGPDNRELNAGVRFQ